MSDDGIIVHVCPGCGQTIDPDTCWCGEPFSGGHNDSHSPVPMGCECGRVTGKTLVEVLASVAPAPKPDDDFKSVELSEESLLNEEEAKAVFNFFCAARDLPDCISIDVGIGPNEQATLNVRKRVSPGCALLVGRLHKDSLLF